MAAEVTTEVSTDVDDGGGVATTGGGVDVVGSEIGGLVAVGQYV